MTEQKQQEKQTTFEVSLTEWEQNQAKYARHRALIAQILKDHPNGLTVQQIVAQELLYFGFSFMTDNRLREMRARGWVEDFGEVPHKWRLKVEA